MLDRIGDTAALAAQRVNGRAELGVVHARGRTRLASLFQADAAKIKLPSVAGDPLEAILINTAGGLTGGDRLEWKVTAGTGSAVAVTTQTCEKLYRARGGKAEMDVELTVGEAASLAWLPQETIAYDGSAFRRRLTVDMADGAEALIVEAAVFGRLAMGEQMNDAIFQDRWRIRREGRLVHAEDFSIGPDIAPMLRQAAVTGGGMAVAAVLMVSERGASLLDQARRIVGDEGGVSAWTVAGSGKLLARLVARDGYSLRKRLIPLVALLNGRAGLPKVWSF